MKILVTGGTGLVGKALQKVIDNENIYRFLSSKDCNLLVRKEVLDVFSEYKPDYVIHLAANVGGLFKNMNQKVSMLEDNLIMNINVLSICHELKVKKVVSCLSTCIFPNETTYPLDEEMLHNGPPHHSNDAYAYSKRILEILSRAYYEQYKDNFICVIPTNIYGLYDNFHLEDSHVIPALIHQCYLAKKENRPFVVRGSGKPLRQFIYSEDLAKLILWTLYNYNEKNPIILSVDEQDEVSIKDIATLIASKFEYSENLIFDNSYSDGQYKKTASNKKLRSYLPEYKFTGIKEGLEQTIVWFNNNYDNIRK